MLELSKDCTVYIACGVTDLRKSFHGLATIVKLKFDRAPYTKCMFAFCNRNCTLMKILHWDGSGFWLLMKRIDKGNFRWPDTPNEIKQVSLKELRWLTEGLSLKQKNAFQERHPKIIV